MKPSPAQERAQLRLQAVGGWAQRLAESRASLNPKRIVLETDCERASDGLRQVIDAQSAGK